MSLAAPASVINTARRVDPTGTTGLRARFVSEMNGRFGDLDRAIRETIIDNDAFGTRRNVETLRTRPKLVAAPPRAFAFRTAAERVDGFMEWLRQQEDAGILERVYRGPLSRQLRWTDLYIDSAYRKGIRDAITKMKRVGVSPPIVGIGDPIRAAFLQPVHAERVAVLYSRTFEDLKTVIEAANGQARRVMADAMARELATAIAEGRAPAAVARKLARDVIGRVDKVGLYRARMIARTEIIRAHHVATITEYERAGMEGVEVDAEILTAGFDVCPICIDAANNGPYTLAQARGLIPLHPHCRCTTKPLIRVIRGEPQRSRRQLAVLEARADAWLDSLLDRFERRAA